MLFGVHPDPRAMDRKRNPSAVQVERCCAKGWGKPLVCQRRSGVSMKDAAELVNCLAFSFQREFCVKREFFIQEC